MELGRNTEAKFDCNYCCLLIELNNGSHINSKLQYVLGEKHP